MSPTLRQEPEAPPRSVEDVRTAFEENAEALADLYLTRFVVRRDVFGGYTGDGKTYTAHEPITRDLLIRHARGEITVGAHSTSTDGRCLTVNLDIDAHDDEADPDRNWRCARTAVEQFAVFGLGALICDSNGKGGYHVRAFLKKPIPAAVAYWCCRKIVAALKAAEFPACEAFPKQEELTLDHPYGNWLRLPGKHPKRAHWMRIFDPKTDAWLEGTAAVKRLLKIAGDDPGPLVKAYRADQDAQQTANGKTDPWSVPAAGKRSRRDDKPPEAEVRSALDYLPTEWAESYGGSRSETAWIGVGMALHDWDEVAGLALWHEFSRRSSKYDASVCDAKWRTFTQGGGLTVRTILKAAYDRGWKWKPPHSGTATHESNGDGRQQNASAGPEPSANGQANGRIDYGTLADADLGLTRASKIKPKAVTWLWLYRLAAGTLALLAGDGGLGKSQLLLAIVAVITRGLEWFDGSGRAPVGDVVILSAEDSPSDTIIPRLMALGADLERVVVLKASVTIRRDKQEPMIHPRSFQDRDYWREVFNRVPDCILFIVDPLPSYLGRGVNDSKNAEIRNILEPFLSEIIEPRGICMLANSHLNKSVDAKTPAHRIAGSIAYANLPRNVHFVVPDPDNPSRRFFKQCKCNNAPNDLKALAFRVERREVVADDGEVIETAIPVFEPEPIAVDLPEIIGGKRGKPGPDPERSQAVAEWLFDFLTERQQPTPLGAIFDAAGAAKLIGHNKDDGKWSNGTQLYRARDLVPKLPAPRDGGRVDDFKAQLRSGGKEIVHWHLIGADSAF